MAAVAFIVAGCSGGGSTATSTTTKEAKPVVVDWNGVDATLGRAATVSPEGVHRYAFPRADLHVSLDGVPLKPAFALGGYLAFLPMAQGTMVMGDLVLLEDEVPGILRQLESGGLAETALHNHLLREQPHVMYLHVMGTGDALTLARAAHDALANTATPLTVTPPATQPDTGLDTAALDRTLRYKGKANGGVYQFSVARAERLTAGGSPLYAAQGVATALNFESVEGGRAAVTGDFAITGAEVDRLLHTLGDHSIGVTALHSHMLDDTPRLFYVHFFAVGDPLALA
jgi:hypothetical protein